MTRSNEPEDVEVHNRSEHPGLARRSAGWIEVIAGSMFSGKSEELIRRLRRSEDRATEGAGFQTRDRQAVFKRSHRLALRDEARIGQRAHGGGCAR